MVRRVDAELGERLEHDRMRRRAGRLPAERASWRPPAARRKSASAITVRPAFAMQTKSTWLMRPVPATSW